MNWIKTLPLRYRLTGIIFLVSMVVLTLVAAGFAVLQLRHFDKDTEESLTALTGVISAASRFPLVFRDQLDAEEILASLRVRDEVVSAYLFDAGKKPLAAYYRSTDRPRPGSAGHSQASLQLEERQIGEGFRDGTPQLWSEQGCLALFRPVEIEGQRVGYLYLRSELTSLYDRYFLFAIGTVVVLGAAAILSLLLGIRLQRLISDPVTRLIGRMQSVARDQKLDSAEIPVAAEEFGMLYQGFDDMLAALRKREQQLETHRLNLEAMVEERTQALLEAKDEAEAANAAKSQFLANMSHEIRTPMIGVLGMAELLRNEMMEEHQRHLVESIYGSGEALLAILNDLLDVAKIEAGKLTLEAVPFLLHDVLADAVDVFAGTARQKGLALSLEIDPGLADRVAGDASRVRQIVLNLVGNAIKFTDHGQVTVTAMARPPVSPDGVGVGIAVRDTGIGIAPDALATIFNPFSQADNSFNRARGGTGLGLTIVEELVNLMGGTVTVESIPGAGSCFTVTLHLLAASTATVQPVSVRRDAAGKPPLPVMSGKGHILLAEDNPTTQDLLRILLQGAGYDLTIVANGQAALEQVAATRFDLIFMDCQMPQLDGLETVRRLRQSGVATPVVALTAHVRREDEERCLAAGMNDFLGKPFRQRDLRAVLERWLPEPVAAGDTGTARGA